MWKEGEEAKIEADVVFARKFVKSEDLFDRELSEPLAEQVGATHPAKDIGAAWIQGLTEGGLSKISDSSVPYTRVVEEFLSGESGKGSYEFKTDALTLAEAGHSIDRLHIRKFREHPVTKYFEFARVNLFRGAKGTGKTSLLGAIEMSI